ncbi:MAG TPA: hypothetical protein VEJ84_17365, partial [Acidimicrobiales bacterium]|nr:hypothetical protein [Acidimicrobiales bacterium]
PHPLRPHDLLQLQHKIGNRAVGRLLRQPAPPTPLQLSSSPPTIQRAPYDTDITGVTHLVRMKDLSLFEGEEVAEAGEGDEIQIDADVTHMSRRGPNQEVFREHDRVGDVSYRWFKVLTLKRQAVGNGIFVREDALASVPTGEEPAAESVGSSSQATAPKKPNRVRGQNVSIGVPFTIDELLDKGKTKWRTIKTQFEELEARGLLLCLEKNTKNQQQSRYVAQYGIEDALQEKKTVPVKEPQKSESVSPRTSSEKTELQPAPQSFKEVQAFNDVLVQGLKAMIYSAPNLREQGEKVTGNRNLAVAGDWFHSFSSMLTLLASRKDVPLDEMTKLIQLELTRYQLQATYGMEDMLSAGRQTSPLVNEGYARGVKTGLWEVSRSVLTGKLIEQISAADPPKKKERIAAELKKINLFPASRPFKYEGREPEVVDQAPKDTAGKPALYISSLKLQTMKPGSTGQSAEEGKVNSFMGARGLRTSPSESARFVASAIAELLIAGKLDQALEIVTGGIKQSKNLKAVSEPLADVNFSTNMIVAPKGIDPLRQSSEAQIGALTAAYNALMELAQGERPFIIKQNLGVIANLCTDGGKRSVDDFFDENTPTTVTADFTDACERAREAALEYQGDRLRETRGPEKGAEHFYQQVQNIHHAIRFQLNWKNDTTSLDKSLRAMLPGETGVAPISTHAAPHGLAILDQVQDSLSSGDKGSVAIMAGAYYETPELFHGAETKQDVTDAELKSKRVIVLEPHPNNAKAETIIPHDPLKLLDNLYGSDTGQHTVIMDVTLNHLGEAQIAAVLVKAKRYIDDGTLNLVFVQSGTKFMQHGMDLVGIGLSMVFNDGKSWGEFNTKMAAYKDLVPDQDRTYIAKMLLNNKEELGAYLQKIRKNTLLLSESLKRALAAEDNALQLTINEDPETVYLAIKPKDSFVTTVTKKPAEEDNRKEVNQKVYKDHLLPALRGLPIVGRDSFGFNLTNLGECITTIRVTLGIEDKGLLDKYCEVITAVGKKLAADPTKL